MLFHPCPVNAVAVLMELIERPFVFHKKCKKDNGRCPNGQSSQIDE